MIYAAGGDFTYIQWGIGSIIARIIVGIYLSVYLQKEKFTAHMITWETDLVKCQKISNPDFRGWYLRQSVRVLVAALALKVVTPLEFDHCIWIIGLFAVGWTLMERMRTVIWTDVMQFFLFVGAGLLNDWR